MKKYNEKIAKEKTVFEKTTLLSNTMQFDKMFCLYMFLIVLDIELL